MANIFDPRQMQKLESPERRMMLPAQAILIRTGLKAGQVMADAGAGTGYFTFPAADIVGAEGRVLAADISEEMLAHIGSKLSVENKDRITLIRSDEHSFCLPDGAADYLLLSLVLHEADDPLMMLRDIHRSVKPGGRCVVVEWIKTQMVKGPPAEHRIAMDRASEILEKAGFCEIEEIVFNEFFYILTAQKQ